MALILAVGTYGSDDPTRAAMPLITAQGAIDRGHLAQLAFLEEATYLLRPGLADQVVAVAFGKSVNGCPHSSIGLCRSMPEGHVTLPVRGG